MCVNKEVSMIAFLVSMGACIILMRRGHVNDRWIAVTLGYIGSMQLLEFFMHSDPDCGKTNRTATSIAFWQNLFQPAVFVLAAIVFSGCNLPWYAWVSTLAYGVYVVPTLINARKPDADCTTTCPDQNTGLRFPYTDVPGNNMILWTVFALAMALPFGAMQRDGGFYIGAILATYVAAVAIGAVRQCDGSPATGSWWCLAGAAIPLVALCRNSP